jgi:hypothetical protein
MRCHKILITILILSNTTLLAQSKPKPLFKKLVAISYEIHGSGKTKKIIVTDYTEINGDRVHVKTVTYRGIIDTSYVLPDTMIVRLNEVFNGKDELKSHIKVKRIKGFGGDESFISYTDDKNNLHNFIAVDIYMDNKLSIAYDMLNRLPFGGKVIYKGKSVKNTQMEAAILKYHNECTYLPPPDPGPPTEKELSGPPTEKN